MARIFISHSSRDNFGAIAVRDWLIPEGWAAQDVFPDVHGIGAGTRWKEALAKANERVPVACTGQTVNPHQPHHENDRLRRKVNVRFCALCVCGTWEKSSKTEQQEQEKFRVHPPYSRCPRTRNPDGSAR